MKIDVRQVEGVTVLEVRGRITIGVGDVALREAIHEALAAGARRIVVDLGGATTMDSSGIGELVSAYTTVTNRGGILVLANLPPKVDDILHVTQLIHVFQVFEEAEEAVAYLRPSSSAQGL